jgi:S1-C subfamily serine protease
MLRKAIVAASLLLVGTCLGWAFQGWGIGRPANAEPQREGFATVPQFPNNPRANPGVNPGFQAGVQPVQPLNFPGANPTPQVQPGLDGFVPMTTEEAVNVSIYERTNRSVVNIKTQSIRPESLFVFTQVAGSGSGSVIDQQGHILTNYHVIDGAKQITVMLYNADAFPADLVGQDPENDIAILKINAPDSVLFPIQWGDSSNLKVGQHIIAIGNPFGFERTMTTGIISSLNRQIESKVRDRMIKSLIQIDAALNQGNSGGPLMNSRGELIGMNTAIATRSGDNSGIGFAIPINTIRRVVPQLIATGRVQRPTIGIMQVVENDKGLLVANLTPNGPAERAGLRGLKVERKKVRRGPLTVEQSVVDPSQADLIIGVDDKNVKNSDDLLGAIEAKKSGDQVVLRVVRQGQIVQVPVILGSED